MNRADPVDLRRALVMVNALTKAGLDFVPVPVLNQDDKNELAMDVQTRLGQIEKAATT